MKKILAVSALALGLSAPAFATTMTITFADDNGEASVWALNTETNEATEASAGTIPYTFKEETRELCAESADGMVCVTFEAEIERTVGASVRYTMSTGGSGLATIDSISE